MYGLCLLVYLRNGKGDIYIMATHVSEIFRKRFRELVDAKGISKRQCAEEMGIPYKTFDNIYNHGRKKGLKILFLVAKYFDVSADYLLGLSDDKKIKGTK